ncbi:MAG: hypothetical protein V4459_15550 [Pseudomonadota bacterium]
MNSETSRLSRRDMIVALAGTIALSACGEASPSSTSAAVSGGQTAGQQTLGTQIAGDATAEIALWKSFTGARFAAGGYNLVLMAVDAQPVVGDRPEQLRRQPFIASFDVVGGGMSGDRTYTMTGASLSPFNIFLSGDTSASARMYALFN